MFHGSAAAEVQQDHRQKLLGVQSEKAEPSGRMGAVPEYGELLFPVVCRQRGGAEAFLETQNPSGSPGRLYHGAAVDDDTIEKLPK